MRTLRVLYHLARADILERIRRRSYLLVLATTVFAGYLFVPPVGASYMVLQVGFKRGIYNSAWIGLMVGLIAAMHLPLPGFYLVRNAVERDRRTGVGQIMATTPTGKLAYVLGKWLSNLAVLVLILTVMTVMSLVMQLVRAEEATLKLGTLVASIWLMGLPVLCMACALAVLTETVSFLRGGLGNVVFFFAWLAALVAVLSVAFDETTHLARPTSDLYGFTRPMTDIQQQILSVEPDAHMGSGLIAPVGDREVSTFAWGGMEWTPRIIVERVLWVGLAAAIGLVSAVPFDRFDPARGRLRSERVGLLRRLQKRIGAVGQPASPRRESPAATGLQEATAVHLTPLAAAPNRWQFVQVLAWELRLLLRGRSLLWYVGTLGLIIGCLVGPADVVRQYLLLANWVWPLLLWSQMGTRERSYNTGQMVFSTPRTVSRQIPAIWLAGVILTVIAGSGGWMHLALAGETANLLAWFVGALFAPALALALGVWTGSSRAFEAVYLLLWYVGLASRVPALDYAGLTAEGLAMRMPVVYMGLTAGLLALALIGRRRQTQV